MDQHRHVTLWSQSQFWSWSGAVSVNSVVSYWFTSSVWSFQPPHIMEHECSDFSSAPTCSSTSPVCAKKVGGFTTGGSSYSNKRHRSLNAMARQEKIVLPPLPPISIPGHKKQNSSPTSIADWNANDHIGDIDIPVRKEPDVDSLNIIFSPRRLVPIRRQMAGSQRRCPSPSDFMGTRCACSILKENFSFRFQQEKLVSNATRLNIL